MKAYENGGAGLSAYMQKRNRRFLKTEVWRLSGRAKTNTKIVERKSFYTFLKKMKEAFEDTSMWTGPKSNLVFVKTKIFSV